MKFFKDPDTYLYLGFGCIGTAMWMVHVIAGMVMTGFLLIAVGFLLHEANKRESK